MAASSAPLPPIPLSPLTGRELRLLRQSRLAGLTTTAKQLGVSAAYLSLVERGHRTVTPSLERRVLELFWGRL